MFKQRAVLAIAALGIAAVDAAAEFDAAAMALYPLLLVIGLKNAGRREPVIWGAICSLLALAGALGEDRFDADRGLAVVAIWVAAGYYALRKETGLAIAPIAADAQIDEASFAKAVIDSSNAAIVHVDLNGTMRTWNNAAEKLFGYTAAEAFALGPEAMWPERRAEEYRHIFQRAIVGETIDRVEIEVLRKDGSLQEIATSVYPVHGSNGSIVGIASISQDIAEEKRAREKRDKLALVVQSSSDAIVTLDLDGAIRSWNPAAENLYGYSADEMIGRSAAVMAPDDSPYDFRATVEALSDVGAIRDRECAKKRKDGTLIEVSCSYFPLKDTQGSVVGVTAISRGIGHQKENRRRQALWQAVVEHTSDAVTVRAEDGTIQVWNPAAERLYGYTAEEMVGTTRQFALPGDPTTDWAHVVGQLRKGVDLVSEPVTRVRKDGSLVRVLGSYSPLRDELGQVIGVAMIARDVTEEERSREHQEMLAGIVESSRDAIVSRTLDGTITSWNRAAEEMYGFSAEEMIGRSVSENHPANSSNEVARVNQVLAEHGVVREEELQRRRKDGSLLEVAASYFPVKDSAGRIAGVASIARPIAEAKELRRQRKLLESVLASSRDAVTVRDGDGTILLWNPAAEQLYGYSAEEMLGTTRQFALPGDETADWSQIIADLQQGKEVMNRPKLRVRKDGSLVLVGGTNSPLRDESGKVIGVAMMARDVTEEQRMREREQLLAGIIRSSHETIVTRTLDGTITSWNPAAERLTGFTAEEMIGQSIFENHFPQDSSTVNRINEEILKGKVVQDEDAVRRRKDGSMFEASVTYFPLLDDVGDVKGVASVTREIGEEKRLRKQRALLEAIAQSSAKAISARDADGVIQFWNPAAERLYGYTAEEVLGTPKQFGLPGDPTIDWARVVQALQQGEDLPEQIGTRKRKDGSFFRVSGVYSPIRDESGDIVGIAAISHDVTEEERARQEIAFLASIVRNSHEAIITRTLDGVVKSWNPGAERLYGWAAEEVIGESISFLLPPDTPMELESINKQVAEGVPYANREVPRVRKDGTRITVSLTISPVRDEQGEIVAVATFSHDIGPIKDAAEERLRFQEQSMRSQKLESLVALAGGVAHDFNNLLTIINANAELALATLPPSSTAGHDIEEIISATERATELTAQMLAYSGRAHLQRRRVDLSKLADRALRSLPPALSAKVRIRRQLSAELPAVSLDPDQIQHVVVQLATNAIEASAQDSAVVVETRVIEANREYLQEAVIGAGSEPGPYISLRVIDSGDGLVRDAIQKIFDPFHTSKFVGRGLGLAAVSGIVRAHRGVIRVESQRGAGSTFELLFPIADQAESTKAPAPVLVRPVETSSTFTILLVDDEPVVRSTTARVLQNVGHKVFEADGIQLALDHVRQDGDRIDLVITDYSMPGGTGLDVLRGVREMRPAMPVIIISGYSDLLSTERLSEHERIQILAKPYSSNEIRDAVQRMMGRARGGAAAG